MQCNDEQTSTRMYAWMEVWCGVMMITNRLPYVSAFITGRERKRERERVCNLKHCNLAKK